MLYRILLSSALCALVLIALTYYSARADDPFGGPVTGTSGNGGTTWGAIYVGEQCAPSMAFPAGAARWFKADSWDDYKMQIWLDDDPPWGAATNYFENNQMPWVSDQSPNKVNGFWMRIYSPDALSPNFWFGDEGHRADLLTTSDGIRPDGTEVNWVGMANHNPFVPNHLLWYEGRFTGWAFARVENKMVWDGNAIVCTHREYSPRPRPPAPPSATSKDSSQPEKCVDGPECHPIKGQNFP